MIGLSLSFCIRDILDGTVDVRNVERIIAGTHFTDRDHFHTGMKHGYCVTYWRKDPVRALQIAMAMWDAGMIEQPRCKNKPAPNIAHGHWMPRNDDSIQAGPFYDEMPDRDAPMSALRKFLES